MGLLTSYQPNLWKSGQPISCSSGLVALLIFAPWLRYCLATWQCHSPLKQCSVIKYSINTYSLSYMVGMLYSGDMCNTGISSCICWCHVFPYFWNTLIYMRKKWHNNRYFLLSRYQVCDSVPNPLHVLTSLIPKQHWICYYNYLHFTDEDTWD